VDVKRLSTAELFGLTPLRATLRQARLVFAGDQTVPKSRFDATSLAILTPRLAIATWRGRRAAGRRVPVSNLFNHDPAPVDDGWSVRVTRVRDFRGGRLTYDSHNGTDFVVPPGTVVVAAAPGRVVARRQEWNRGGLKLYVDHGDGLMTTYNHLGRALVDVGSDVARGTPIALSAYSGVDGLLAFPWSAPHVHFNVSLDGVLVDPFAAPADVPLWRAGNAPTPATDVDDAFTPTVFDPARVETLRALLRVPDARRDGFQLLIEAQTYPTRFSRADAGRVLFSTIHPRAPRLDLPFRAADYDGIAFCDDLGFRAT
jgi:murein DD-endopeptidase MepM/ murein hydrolase activator NlpD